MAIYSWPRTLTVFPFINISITQSRTSLFNHLLPLLVLLKLIAFSHLSKYQFRQYITRQHALLQDRRRGRGRLDLLLERRS